jgi:signal transduction histidine kinase
VSRSLARLMGGDLTYRREGGLSVFELSLPGQAPTPH